MRLPWTILAALPVFVSAGVEFTSPKAGSTITAGTQSASITVEWKNGGDGPALADLQSYEVTLWAGGNDISGMAQISDLPVGGRFDVGGNTASFTLPLARGGDKKNAYFIKMVAVATKGGQLITYSPRFTISGMKGVFPPTVLTGLETVTGEEGPATVDNTANPAGNPQDGDFGIAYTMQTGATRYAPMQPVPPTKITQKKHTPAYPTSAIQTIATTFLPIPKQKTTVTKVQTFSVSSRENPAAPASHPTDDMAKFLNRWKD